MWTVMIMGRLLCLAACVALIASSASADSKKRPPVPVPVAPAPPPPQDDTPWGKGVSAERKAAAQRSLGEGNDLFVQNKFREALAKYEEAVASWDHPAIRFNMVRTLIALDRPLDASKSLERALAFGKGPLEDSMYTEALNYQKLLAGQIAEYEVSCKQPGVKVKVNGESLLDCPGAKGKQTLPGNHVVVAAKAGFVTQTQDVVLLPGKKQPIVIELISLEKATLYKPRWKPWKPWAVVGGGAVLVGLGALLDLQANNDLDQLAAAVSAGCDDVPGTCTADEYREIEYEQTESRAITKNRIAIGMMATGGAVVIGGIVAVILNRPRPYVSETREPTKSIATIVPTFGHDGGGVAVLGRF
jgi:hypothetical protein